MTKKNIKDRFQKAIELSEILGKNNRNGQGLTLLLKQLFNDLKSPIENEYNKANNLKKAFQKIKDFREKESKKEKKWHQQISKELATLDKIADERIMNKRARLKKSTDKIQKLIDEKLAKVDYPKKAF